MDHEKSEWRRSLLAAACVLLCLAGMPAWAAFPFHTFDTDAQGWQFASGGDYSGPISAGGAIANWDARGNPDGALSAPDVYYQTYVAAPAAFLGNQSDMYGKSFSYDILIRYTDYVDYCPVSIYGAGISLAYAAPRPAPGVWETRTVTFDETKWRVTEMSGPVATAEQLQAVLANLEGLYLGTEWHSGGDDTSVDNVGLSGSVPGDIDGDGHVDVVDLLYLVDAFGSVSGEPSYNAAADFNHDDSVDVVDLLTLVENFGT
jgi:hypothetical protein